MGKRSTLCYCWGTDSFAGFTYFLINCNIYVFLLIKEQVGAQ